MSSKPKILAFAGSTRKSSFNKRLVRIAAAGAASAGAAVTHLDLADYPLPLFDEDLESAEGKPENAAKIKQMMMDHHGFLISSPEYNSSITAVLKNVIDWVSRPDSGESPMALAAFRGKVATLMSASPGGLGGLRGLVHLRAILGNIGMVVLPDQMAVSKAYDAFKDDVLADGDQQRRIEALGSSLTEFLKIHTT